MDQKTLRAYIGDPNQLLSFQEARLVGGRQEGVRVVNVSNGAGLQATLLPDRCMDLYQLRFHGVNLNYISPVGIVAPTYYDARDLHWLRGFFVGFLTSCGLQNIGTPGTVMGEEQGLHGRIANTPAERFCAERGWEGDTPTLRLSGTMRETRLFGEHLSLTRSYRFVYEQDCLEISDIIRNEGFADRAFVYGLHLNFGYPLLEEGTEVELDSEEVRPRTPHAAQFVDSHLDMEAPSAPYPERCYAHKLRPDAEGRASYSLYNPRRNLGVRVSYPAADFPAFMEWKMLGKGEYVLGLEPFNYEMDQPRVGEPGCGAPVLAPGEEKHYSLRVEAFRR